MIRNKKRILRREDRSLPLDNIGDGFRDRRRVERSFRRWAFRVKELSELNSNSEDKGEGAFEKENDSSHLSPDGGSRATNNSWTIQDPESSSGQTLRSSLREEDR